MTTRVYRLDIIYPEGCRLPGWHPARWSDPAYLATLTREQRREVRGLLKKPFKWPRERMFLSASGAHGRAWRLRFYGAEVEVEGSAPVTWPNPDDAGDDWAEVAARWHPALADYADAMPLEPVTTPPGEAAGEQETAWRAERQRQANAYQAMVMDEHAEFYDAYFERARQLARTDGAMYALRAPGNDITMAEYRAAKGIPDVQDR